MSTSLKVSSLLFLILLNFACFNRFAKTPQPEKEFSETKKHDVAAQELSREPDLTRLLKNLNQTSQHLKKSSEEALELNYSLLETRGTNSDSDGLQIISSVLSSFSDTCHCEYRILMLYGPAQEKFKSELALRLSLTLETEKSKTENLMKQYRLGHSALESNDAIRFADKAKQQINEAQKLVDELIRFYALEHQLWKQ